MDRLIPREREVAHLVATGRSNSSICSTLHIAPKTLDRHLASIYAKLGLRPDDTALHRRVRLTLLVRVVGLTDDDVSSR